MSALLVINYDTVDHGRLAAYRAPAVEALVANGGGSPTIVTDDTVDLGEGHGVGATTVALRFDSVAAARAAFESDAYQDVVGERIAATNPAFAMIVPELGD